MLHRSQACLVTRPRNCPDKDLSIAPHYCFQGVYDIVPMFPRRIEAKHLLQLIEEFGARSLRYADCAITLNV